MSPLSRAGGALSFSCFLIVASGCASPGDGRAVENAQSPEPVASPLAEGVGGDSAWQHVVARYDEDGDQRITPEEHGRGAAAFARLDQDRDGALTEADFQALQAADEQRVPPGALTRVGGPLGRCADTDDDGRVSREDWAVFVSRVCRGDELDREVFGNLGLEANRTPFVLRMLDADRDGAVTRAELLALFDVLDLDGNGRIADVEFGIDEMLKAPKAGAEAPDFELPLVDDPSRTIRLSSFRGDRPVALIFGSYT